MSGVKVGDWVRFHYNGRLCIAVVNYVRNKREYYPWTPEYLTDIGVVSHEQIVEVRGADTARVVDGVTK